MKPGDVWVPPAAKQLPVLKGITPDEASISKPPSMKISTPQASMTPPRIAPPEVNVTVNPNEPEVERPLIVPAAWTASNVERLPRNVTSDQDDGTARTRVSTLLAESNKPVTGDNKDIVRELQNIARMIQTGLSRQTETRKVPQETPAFNPRFGRLAEGSI